VHTREQALIFAREWIEGWNAHDLDTILSHYTDDFELTTPFIVTLMNDPSGTLKGKARIREYWARGLERFPDLKFELVDVYVGVRSLVICYRAILGKVATEVLFFDEAGLVSRSAVHYDTM
jgi:ketosteroid isomerase-like protein